MKGTLYQELVSKTRASAFMYSWGGISPVAAYSNMLMIGWVKVLGRGRSQMFCRKGGLNFVNKIEWKLLFAVFGCELGDV